MTGETSATRHDLHVAAAGMFVAAMLVVISAGGQTIPAIYGRETASWAAQAFAQDWFDLVVAAPLLALAAARCAGGSRKARLVLAGGLLYSAYTFAIYCFAVHLNVLFLGYCAGLGASLLGLAAIGAGFEHEGAASWFERALPRRTIAIVLIAIGAGFAGLWLAQLLPAMRDGVVPPELEDAGLATNPIQVLDLSIVLPLHVIAGVALWRRRPIGEVLATTLLAFGALMAASIAVLVVVSVLRGRNGSVPVAIGMVAVSALCAVLLSRMLRAIR